MDKTGETTPPNEQRWVMRSVDPLVLVRGWGSGRTLRITPQLADADVSPHTLRRRKAMHLNEASVPLSYLRDSPGHVELSITLSLHAREVMRSV